MLIYGGGGPLGLAGVVEGLDFKEVITLPFAAVFSAFGVLCAPRRYRYHQGTISACPAGDDGPSRALKGAAVEAINAAWASLEERAKEDFALHGWDFAAATLNRSAYVRFTNQLSDFEVPWGGERLTSIDDLHELMRSYEHVYTSIYPKQALYSEVGYQILELALSADVESPKPAVPILELRGRTPPSSSLKGQRLGHWRGQDITFALYEMDELQAGNVVNGPAVIEHPATTLLVPPTHHVEFDARRLIHYRAGQA